MRGEGLRGVHVFAGIAAFFGVMILIQAVFVIQAVRTFPGEEVEKSYVQGLDYNATLERRAAQKKLGWSAEAGAEDGTLIIRLADRAGAPLTGLDVSTRMRRVGSARELDVVQLAERRAGEYAFDLTDRTPGRLELAIDVRRRGGEAIAFEAAKTLVLP